MNSNFNLMWSKCPNCDSEKESYITDEWVRCYQCDAIVTDAPIKLKTHRKLLSVQYG